MYNRKTKQSFGSCVVIFHTADGAARAKSEVNGRQVSGCNISVEFSNLSAEEILKNFVEVDGSKSSFKNLAVDSDDSSSDDSEEEKNEWVML
eukprot:UN01318